MESRFRTKAGLLSRASTVAILAAAGSFGVVQQAQANCNSENETVITGTNPAPLVGSYDCVRTEDVTGNVTNNGTIGDPGDGDAAFVVGDGGITGTLLNNGIITGGGFGGEGSVQGALWILNDVAGGVRNDGIVSSAEGNGIQLGYGTSDGGISVAMTGTITNSGAVTATVGDGVAAILGSMTGALVNEDDGTISGGNRAVYISDDFTSWTGGIFNAGQIQGNTAGIQIGDLNDPEGSVVFAGGITNEFGGKINSLTGPTLAIGGASFEGGIRNHGEITQRDLELANGDDDYAGVGIVVSAQTFSGGIENTGEIDGLGGPAIWITGFTDNFGGGIQNRGLISGAEDAVRIQSNTFSGGLFNDFGAQIIASSGNGVTSTAQWFGDFTNHGSIGGTAAGVYISTEGSIAGEGEGETAEFLNTGSITGGITGFLVVGSNVAANFTNTSADPQFLPPGVIDGGSGAGIVLAASESWTGNVTNDGTISGLLGAVLGGTPGFEGAVVAGLGDFNGIVTNNGLIHGDGFGLVIGGDTFDGQVVNNNALIGDTGVGMFVEVDQWIGDITNVGLIEGGFDGVNISSFGGFEGTITNGGSIVGSDRAGFLLEAQTFEGAFVNNGYIEGGLTGARFFVFDSFDGSVTNNGTIVGGAQFDVFTAAFDPGLVVSAGSMTGDITNNGTLSAFSNALIVDVGNLDGSVVNTGLIEAVGGDTAILLEVGNGTTFVNTDGGTIHGDIIFGGKAPYDFVAEDGGIVGSVFGTDDSGGEGTNDDIVTVQGTHTFEARLASAYGPLGDTLANFAEFNVANGGVAIVGAGSIGDVSGTGYVFTNVDELNVQSGGQLYLDKQAQLNVGDYTQSEGGTTTFFLSAPVDGGEFSIAATSATPGVNYGQIIASGAVNLDGTIAAVLDPLSFAGTNLTEIEYNDVIVGTSLTGDFDDDQIFGDSYFFTLSHVIDGSTVDLRLSRTGFNNIPCSNGNNDSFGNALEAIFNSGGPINDNLFQYLAGLSESEVCSSYDELGGTVLADLGAVVVETAGPWKSMVNDRLNGIGSGGCSLSGDGWCLNRFAANEVGAGQVMTDATPDDPFAWLRTGTRRVGETAVWGRLVGVWGDTSGSAGVGGTDFQINGGIVGVDHVFTPVLLAGVAAQWTSNEIDFDGRPDSADVDSIEIGAYMSYGDTRFYVNANASFIWHDFDVHRKVLGLPANGTYDGTTISAYAEAGKIFETGSWRIQPLVALSYAHLETDAYSERGTAIELLNVQGSEFDSLKGMIGARVAYPIELKSGRKMVPEARLVWAHEFMDDHSSFTAALQSAPNVPFVITGQDYSRDTLVVGAGLTAPISEKTTLFIDYDAGINPDITTHTVSAGFRMRW